MKRLERLVLIVFVALPFMSGVVAVGTSVPAGAAAAITLPDLQILVPTDDISIGSNPVTHDRQLQFTHITWDAGAGPFAIQPHFKANTGMSTFVQDIYRRTGPTTWAIDHTVPVAASGTFDPPSDYRLPLTRFTLNVANPDGTPGALVAVSPKTDYCITADTYVGGVPHTPNQTSPPQSNCTNPTKLLGFSVGWGDEYDQTDNGQPIDLTGVPDGTYVLQATVDPQHVFTESDANNNVVDTELQIAGDSVTVLSQVSPVTVPPTIALTSPAAGSQVQGTVTLSATATASAPATVASVQYLLDGEPLGPPVTSAPYAASWTVGNTPVGRHTLSAQVTDSNGSVGTAPVEKVHVVANSSGGLSIDTSTTQDGRGTVSTKAFSTKIAGDTLVAFAGLDGPNNGIQTTTVKGAGLTWHLVTRADAQLGDAEVWTATASGVLNDVQVTSRPEVSGYAQQLTVLALSGAAGTGASASASGPTGAPSVTITSQAAGSDSFAVGADWDNAIPRTLGTGQSLIDQWVDSSDGDTFWVQGTSDASAAAGEPVTIDDSAPTTDQWNMAAVEVMPAPTSTPELSLVNPAPDQVVSAATPVAAVVHDGVPVRSVQFFVDGHSVAEPVRSPSYAVRWDTTRVGNGLHNLTVVATDAEGRIVRADEDVVVANPAPAMTCFVLQARVSARGAGRVIAPAFHTASAGERLFAFVGSAPGTSRRAVVSGSGLDWHVVRGERSRQGDVAVWTAVAPKVLDAAAVSSWVPTGDQNLTVIAMEGTEGLGASVAASGSRGRPGVSLTTTRPTSLVLAAGIDAGASTSIPPGWAAISQDVHLASGQTAWVQYTNQPTNDPPQTVNLPQLGEARGGWATVAVELPGDGS
jgi:Bacterial Ig domain/Lysyl oxidase